MKNIKAEIDIENTTQEELVEYILKLTEKDKYFDYEDREAVSAIKEDGLKKIIENEKITDSQLNMIFSYVNKKEIKDYDYWSKVIKDRIDNHESDEIGETLWRVVTWGLKPNDDLIEKVLLETDYGLPYNFELGSTELAKKILEKSDNNEAINKAIPLLVKEKDKESLKNYIIERPHKIKYYFWREFEDIADQEDYEELLKKVKNIRVTNDIVDDYIEDTDILKKYIKENIDKIDDPQDVGRAIRKLAAEIDDEEFFAKLAERKRVLRSNPEILTKFYDEDLLKSIIEDSSHPQSLAYTAAKLIKDQDYIKDYINNAEEDDRVLSTLLQSIEDEEYLKDIVDTNKHDLREDAVPLIKDQDYLQEILKRDYNKSILRDAVGQIENEDFLTELILKNELHPDILRRAKSNIESEEKLKEIAASDKVLFDIRRDILEANGDIEEELGLDSEDFEEEKLIEKLGEADEDLALLIIKSIDDEYELKALFENEEQDSVIFDFIMQNYMADDFEDYLEKIKDDKDKVEYVANNLNDTEALKAIIEDDLLSDWDYYDKGSIGEIVLDRNDNDDHLIYEALRNQYAGDDEYDLVQSINDQAVLENIAREDWGAARYALQHITDEDTLKEAMDWGEEYADYAYGGISDPEFLADWVEKQDSFYDSDFAHRLVEHIASLDNSDDHIRKIYLDAVEKNSEIATIALNYLKDENLLQNAINSPSSKVRQSALNHLKDEKIIRMMALEDVDEKVRAYAVKKLKGKKNLDILKKAAEDESSFVRTHAFNNIEDQDFLREHALKEKIDHVLIAIVANLKPEENQEFLADLYGKVDAPNVANTILEKLDYENNKELLNKVAQSDDLNLSQTALKKLNDEDLLLKIALNEKAVENTRLTAIDKIQKQATLLKAAKGSGRIGEFATIRLDGDHLPEELYDVWFKAFQRTAEPHKVPFSARLKVVEGWENLPEKEDAIRKILKTLPYRHIPEQWREKKRDISFDKPELKQKDIKLHIPKANVQLYRLLLMMAR